MYILMSIKPKFAKLILQGQKTVEIRRTNIKAEKGDRIAIYSSTPQKRIVGYFTISDIQYGEVDQIWQEFGKNTCLSVDEYEKYLAGKNKACAIRIASVEPKEGFSLEEILSEASMRVPQSYRYISGDAFCQLCKLDSVL